MEETMKLVGYGVDTLILNVRYTDKEGQPFKQELDEKLAQELDYLQGEARRVETAVATDWSFLNVLLFVEPHGAGKQWRWLLTSRLLTLVVSRGKFNDVIAQVRFSSEFLWSQAWCGDALTKVHSFLMALFGECIHLQVSEVHLCADVVGYDFSKCDYITGFVTRVRKNEATYSQGADGVLVDCYKTEDERQACRRVSTLRFSGHGSPLSCSMYNKTLEIKQKSGKTFFYDLWRKGVEGLHGGKWDGVSEVWRVEFRFKREFLHQVGIEWAYDLLDELRRLWEYAAGHVGAADDGLPDGWLRYVLPGEDSNRSRWLVHPAWLVVQAAFTEDADNELGSLVRRRIREKNLERGIASTIGYISTLAAWLGGVYVGQDTDVSLVLHWLAEVGPEYLESKQRDFLEEVRKKQKRYGSTQSDEDTEVAS